jgi:hypothetical protein
MLAGLVGPRVVSAHGLGGHDAWGLACEQRQVWPSRLHLLPSNNCSILSIRAALDLAHRAIRPPLKARPCLTSQRKRTWRQRAFYFFIKWRVTFSYCASRGKRNTIALLYRLLGGADDRWIT